ncbi:amidohydrolase family protein [Planctomycetales bacterium ZRK34]|nr:amidohydrolase family protein [Planctomycetales bacterium ZRK34]
MIIAGTLMLEAPMRQMRLAAGWLLVEDGRIVEVHESDCPHTPDLGGDRHLVFPGFVDTHLHLPQFDCIGADGLKLLPWLEQVIYPAEAQWEDADFAGAATERAIMQLLARGTTSFAAYTTVHHDATRAAIRCAAEMNVRAIIGQTLMDQQAPPELIRPAQQLLDETESLLSAGAVGRVTPAVTPRFAVSCSETLLRGCGALTRAYDAPVQTHLAETQKECQAVYDLHDKMDYTELYLQAELLTPRTIFGHGIWLDAAARMLIAEAGSTIAHCPTANAFLNSGTMDRHAHHMAHVKTCLGSDLGAGTERGMVRVAQSMIQAAKSIGRLPPTPAEAWHQITIGNADALGFEQVGRLQAGAEADLLLIEPDVNWRQAVNPLACLLYAWDDRWLDRVILRGQVR